MKKLQLLIISAFAVIGIGAAPVLLTTTPVYAESPAESIKNGCEAAGDCDGASADLPAMIKTIANVLLFILGAIAVIMIIIGGIRYTTSNGDSSSIQAAKNTILYAVIGLIVAILAYAIVNFVVDAFSGR